MEKIEQLKKLLNNMATLLPTHIYLKYKKDIAQCSKIEALEVIGVNLIKTLCIYQ
jgi:hypothetical protein